MDPNVYPADVMLNELVSMKTALQEQQSAFQTQQAVIMGLHQELQKMSGPGGTGTSNLPEQLGQLRLAWEDVKTQINSLSNREQARETCRTVPETRLPSGIKIPKLEPLFGKKNDDLKAWIFQAEEQFSLLNISGDELKIRIAGMALRGAAQTWYHSIRSEIVPEEERPTSWNAFKEALQAQFSPIDPVKVARDELAELKQEGNVRDYTCRFRHLCTLISNLSEAERLDRYVRGLKPRTKREVELREPTTFAEVTKLAEKVDSNFERVTNKPKGFFPHPKKDGPTPMELGVMKGNKPPSKDTKEKHGPLTPEEREYRRTHGLCLYCGSDKHLRKDCPTAPRPKSFQGNGQGRPQKDA
jgi:hypothetical protein